MQNRLFKIVLLWNAALTAILLASLLVNANFALAANDPPVKVFTARSAHAGGLDGSGTTTNVSINSDASWTQLMTVDVNFGTQNHAHQCVAIASADVLNPFSGSANQRNSYFFDLTVGLPNGGSTDGPGTRTVELINNSTYGNALENITTNRAFFNIQNGAHTIYFLGRKSTGAPNANVADSSMSVICLKVTQ
jgi:hypothetical protein